MNEISVLKTMITVGIILTFLSLKKYYKYLLLIWTYLCVDIIWKKYLHKNEERH